MIPGNGEPPKLSHAGHLRRLALELAQTFCPIAALGLFLRTGVTALSIALAAASVIATLLLRVTPRPPLPGWDDRR